MNYKAEVLSGLEKLLDISSMEFVVGYWDREKDTVTSYKYRIGDSKS